MNIFFRQKIVLFFFCTAICIILAGVAWRLYHLNVSAAQPSLENLNSITVNDCGNALTNDFYVLCGYYTTPRINNNNVQIPFVVIKKREVEHRNSIQTQWLSEQDVAVNAVSLKTPAQGHSSEDGSANLGLSNINWPENSFNLQDIFDEQIPLVVLPGGPGSATGIQSKSLQYWLGWYHRQGLSEAVVLMDYRGLGGSIPAVDCASTSSGSAAIEKLGSRLLENKLSINYSESELRFLSLVQCWQIAQNFGYSELDFSAETNATDLLGLAKLLNIHKLNIYARSYGTRVAVIAALQQSDLINSMVLDSLHSLENNDPNQWPLKYQQAFLNLIHYCKTSSLCSVTDDSLKRALDNRKPVSATSQNDVDTNDTAKNSTVENSTAENSTAENKAPTNNSADFNYESYLAEAIFQKMREHNSAKNIQQLLTASKNDWYADDASINSQRAEFGDVVYFVNQCIDNNPLDHSVFSKNLGEIGYLSQFVSYDTDTDFCRLLQYSNYLAPYKSANVSVETILLAGGLDPVTQLSQVEAANSHFLRSTLFIFPDAGHVLIDQYPCLDDALPFLLHNQGPDYVYEHCSQQSVRILIR
ncbi:hypothetical protein MAH1_04520 [Sessilibacter sp. MAH1]